MKTKPFLMLAFMLMATGFVSKPLFSTPDIQPPAGRIAIVADGNSPDPDDLGATAVSIALLRAAGLEDRLVHYSHSCDLVRGSRISEEDEFKRHGLMQTACDGTASRWGGFESFTFYDAMWQKEQTIEDLRDAINASSATDPLWIVEAGEPDIIGFALEASDADKYQYVKVITHHPANDDAGDFYTWQQILDFGIEEVRIPDQNTHLKVDLAHWDWAKNHSDPRIQWIWSQGKIAEEDHVVKFQKGMWDCSDAGMILYWITGATSGGLEEGSVTDVKELLLEYVARNPQSFQDGDIQKTLNDINTRFKNVEVSIVNWPDDLQQKLGKLKKSAFMASPRFESTGKLPLLISLHGAGGKTWSLDEQLARSATVKGLSLVEMAGKELILIEPNSFDDWDPKTLNIMLDYLLDYYPQIDPNRVYLMGHSMGGRGTWDWILNSPERFAAAAPCGFSSVSDNDEIERLVNLPVWGMVGANDGKNVEPVKKMTDLISATGNKNVRYTAFPEADHAKGNAAVFSSVEWIDWMLTFSLQD